MPLFSVIVPVHNSEKTLLRCLASLQIQTEPDFEVLLAENGSRDASAAICRDFSQQDERFQLIALAPDRGPSGARNAALAQARGQWIAFVDSDDYVEAHYLTSLRETFEADEPDAVFFGYHQETAHGQDLGCHIPEIGDGLSLSQQLCALSGQDLFGYTWIKAFRRETIGQSRFPEDLNLFEDEVFACTVLQNARRIAVLPKALYHYVTGSPGSLMGRTHADYPAKCDRVFRAWAQLLEGQPLAAELLTRKANAAASRCMYYCCERDVELRSFVDTLADSEFFTRHTDWTAFDRLVQKRRYRLLWLEKQKYGIKQFLRQKRLK